MLEVEDEQWHALHLWAELEVRLAEMEAAHQARMRGLDEESRQRAAWSDGYRLANECAGVAHRERMLKALGPAWSPDVLRGFLDGHEQWTRNALCTCRRCCPIHDNVEHAVSAGAS